MEKQAPYHYSADAIRNTHDFCKREKEDGLITDSGERKSINSNRSLQKYDRAGNAT